MLLVLGVKLNSSHAISIAPFIHSLDVPLSGGNGDNRLPGDDLLGGKGEKGMALLEIIQRIEMDTLCFPGSIGVLGG